MLYLLWRNPEATEKAFAPDGWFRTGDLVRQDVDSYIYVVDRIKNMFISGGENVYPAEIERVLIGHIGVEEGELWLPYAANRWVRLFGKG